MRKSIAFIFLLLANLVLLAHTMIPHHHHDRVIVCIGEIHCSDNEDSHNHQASNSHAHKHNDSSSSKECIIKDIYTRVDNSKQISGSGVDKYIEFPDSLLFSDTHSLFNIWVLKATTYNQKKYLISYYPVFFTQPIGLRAPPFC